MCRYVSIFNEVDRVEFSLVASVYPATDLQLLRFLLSFTQGQSSSIIIIIIRFINLFFTLQHLNYSTF